MPVVKVTGGFLEIEGAGIGGRPDNSLPSGGGGARPGHELPSTPVPPTTLPIPPPPPEIAGQIVVAVHRPGHDWVVRAYDPVYVGGGPIQPQPAPQ